MDNSFTLGSTEEVDNVKILQSCPVCFCVVVRLCLLLIRTSLAHLKLSLGIGIYRVWKWGRYAVLNDKMDNLDIPMEEYIRFEEEKACRRGQVYNWETATYGKIWYDEDVHYLRSFEKEFTTIVYNDALTSGSEVSYDFENEFPAIVYNDALATNHKISSEPSVNPLDNNEIDFRISLDESDDEDYICIYDKSSFFYKLTSVNDLKTDSRNDNDKVNIELPLNDGSIKPSDSIINDNADTNPHEFDESFETNHDINHAFHWLETENRQLILYKLNIEDHDHPIITTIEIPHGLHQGRNFLQSFGDSIGSDNPMLVVIDILGILHLQGRLFKSRGCLLLVCRDNIGSRDFTIYEMMKGCSMWTVRYLVNTDDSMTSLPE
ncbi:hypothetical protein Tco_0967227 [Tanacetum coccineum]